MTTLAVAAVAARMLAEAAALDGHAVVALDLFGDADTRRASQCWWPIGAPGSMRIDADCVLGALHRLARQHRADVIGWIPGSGFEGQPDLLEAGARILPLIGTPVDAVRRVRDPDTFFGVLAAHGIAYPAVSLTAPADADGWLLKDANGCGGWHIRHAGADPGVASEHAAPYSPYSPYSPCAPYAPYYQREMPGAPMSATFIADGAQAMLLGINELIVRPLGMRPHVYAGCIGPVAVTPDVAHRVDATVRVLTAEFGLRGWCSLDFICDGNAIGVLEVNPRPPASLALYAQRGLIDAQLRACLQGELPRAGAFAARHVAGQQIVYARHSSTLAATHALHLASRADVHDLPAFGTRIAAGGPVCSVSAAGDSAEQVKALLAAARDRLIRNLETPR